MENPIFATRWNLDEIDSNYLKWLEDRSSVGSNWQYFFEGFQLANEGNVTAPGTRRKTLVRPITIRSKNMRVFMVPSTLSVILDIRKEPSTPY